MQSGCEALLFYRLLFYMEISPKQNQRTTPSSSNKIYGTVMEKNTRKFASSYTLQVVMAEVMLKVNGNLSSPYYENYS